MPDRFRTFGAQLWGGVDWREVGDRCYRRASWEIWTYPTTPTQDSLVQEYIQETRGEKYDWRAIASFGLGERDWRTAGSTICSEWAMGLLERTGIARLPRKIPVARVTPRDLYMIFTVAIGVCRDQAFCHALERSLERPGPIAHPYLLPRPSPLVPEASG
jgi:hypothetical protein